MQGLRETVPGEITTVIGFREEAGGIRLWGYDDLPEEQHPESDVAAILAGYSSVSRLDAGCATPCWRLAQSKFSLMPKSPTGGDRRPK